MFIKKRQFQPQVIPTSPTDTFSSPPKWLWGIGLDHGLVHIPDGDLPDFQPRQFARKKQMHSRHQDILDDEPIHIGPPIWTTRKIPMQVMEIRKLHLLLSHFLNILRCSLIFQKKTTTCSHTLCFCFISLEVYCVISCSLERPYSGSGTFVTWWLQKLV